MIFAHPKASAPCGGSPHRSLKSEISHGEVAIGAIPLRKLDGQCPIVPWMHHMNRSRFGFLAACLVFVGVLGCGDTPASSPAEESSGINIRINTGSKEGDPSATSGLDVRVNSEGVKVNAGGVNVDVE